jgi:trehalose 6-phosphate synthase
MIDLDGRKLVVVSNRLPVTIDWQNEQWEVHHSPGGLVTALQPIVRATKGVWLGWPGCPAEVPAEELLRDFSASIDFDLVPVEVSDEEINRYYRGFSNKTIWPLFHDLLGHFSFDQENWETYLEVNRRFAEKIADWAPADSVLWIHDYQLLMVGHFLRELGYAHRINFFLHIPFPHLDLLRRLPRHVHILRGMLAYSHIGLQTPTDHRNFINCVKWLIPEAKRIARRRRSVLRFEDREILTGFYPISIDYREFDQGARTKEVDEAAWYLRENLRTPVLALGLDRLDYTKGIPERFLAFERMLEKYPDTRRRLSLLQVVVPSRLNVAEYQELKVELDYLAGRINGRFSSEGWVPIFYQFRKLDRVQLLAHYKSCEIALITPLRDGMNLIAKEYCASSVDSHGVLILSEFAGATEQLSKGAILVNPFDTEATADAIYQAFRMSPEERRSRMTPLRNEVKRYDVARWVDWILNAPQTLDQPTYTGSRQSERRFN